jgi:HEAT repeat protein
MEWLNSPSEDFRTKAVVALVKSNDKRALPFLEKSASEDVSPKVRYYARKGIGYLSQKTTPQGGAPAEASQRRTPPPVNSALIAPDVIDSNLSSEDQWTRLQTIRAIEHFQASSYIPNLIVCLATEENRQVTSALLLAIGKIGGPLAIDAIVPFLESDDSRIRANAIEAIDASGDNDALIHLIPYLRDEDNRCRANAVLALKKYGPVNVFKTLEGMILSEEVWMQDSATFVLGRMGAGNKTFELLQLALSSKFLVVRQQAKGVLQTLADRGVDRAHSILDRLSQENQQGSSDEDLFARLEQLSILKTGNPSDLDDDGVDDGLDHREQNSEDIYSRLHALSKTEAQEDLDESGPKNVQELLDERSDAIYAKLMAISKTVD